jgi:recombination protein RecT
MESKPTTTVAAPQQQSVQSLMNSKAIKNKVLSLLGSEKVAAGFISSVVSVANGNPQLKKADPMTVIGAAMVAATLNLPIVPTIGLAYIVPYKGKAQFQISYKGLIELAERSGQFKNIIDEVVFEGQLVKKNKFTGDYIFDEDAKKSNKVVGYMARFDLVNGFSKTLFWTKEEVDAHARKFSQAFRSGYDCPWKSDYDAMARKTVLKALFSKYAPKSIQMQNAIQYDQAVVRANDEIAQADNSNEVVEVAYFDTEYPDNDSEQQPQQSETQQEQTSEISGILAARRAKKAAQAAQQQQPTEEVVTTEQQPLSEQEQAALQAEIDETKADTLF